MLHTHQLELIDLIGPVAPLSAQKVCISQIKSVNKVSASKCFAQSKRRSSMRRVASTDLPGSATEDEYTAPTIMAPIVLLVLVQAVGFTLGLLSTIAEIPRARFFLFSFLVFFQCLKSDREYCFNIRSDLITCVH